jgi:hypothetical protein
VIKLAPRKMSRVTIEVIQNNASPRPSLRLTANNLALATVQMHSRITTKTLLFTAKRGVMSPLLETVLSICRLPFYCSYGPNTEKRRVNNKNDNELTREEEEEGKEDARESLKSSK